MSARKKQGPALTPEVARDAVHRLPLALSLADPHADDCPLVYVNEQFTRLTGYGPDEAVGKNCRFLQGPDTDRESTRKLRETLEAGEEITVDLLNYRADGSTFTNRLHIGPLRNEDGSIAYFVGMQIDVSEASDDDERPTTIDQRLLMLQHRVKNHLSMVLALIRLEALQSQDRAAFENLTRRVETLSILYDQFTDTNEPDAAPTVPLGAYLSRVCVSVQQVVDPLLVRVNLSIDETHVDQDTAARLGLFLSEALDNGLRHAFDDGAEGEIDVSMTCEGRTGILTVRDDGRGMEPGTWPADDSLGGKIIRDLVGRLEGELDVSDGEERGTVITLRFPIPGVDSKPAADKSSSRDG